MAHNSLKLQFQGIWWLSTASLGPCVHMASTKADTRINKRKANLKQRIMDPSPTSAARIWPILFHYSVIYLLFCMYVRTYVCTCFSCMYVCLPLHGWHLWRSEHLSKALELALQAVENHKRVLGMKSKSSARISSAQNSEITSPAPFLFIFKQWKNKKEQIVEVSTSCT